MSVFRACLFAILLAAPPAFAQSSAPPSPPPPTEAQLAKAALLTNPVYSRAITGADLARYFPDRALSRGRDGQTALMCLVIEEGALTCVVTEETPSGWGFGQAALLASRLLRIAPLDEAGKPVKGRKVELKLAFRPG